MAEVTKNDIQTEAAFMARFWEVVKKYWIIEDNDQYWDSLTDTAHELYVRYPTDFCKAMTLAYLDFLNEKGRRQMRGERKNEHM